MSFPMRRSQAAVTLLAFTLTLAFNASATGAPSAPASAGAAAGAAPAAASGGAAASGTSGYQNAAALLKLTRRTLFVLVYGPDSATTNFVAYEVSLRLTNKVLCARPDCSTQYTYMTMGNPPQWVLPEPAWTLADYATQCQNDPEHTAGALIIYDIENDAGTFSWIVYQTAYTHLYAKAVLVDCANFTIKDAPLSNITTLSQSTVLNSGGLNGESVPAVVGSVPPPLPKVVTKTETETAVPQMRILWQNSDNLSARGRQGAVPFLGLAALGAYLAQRFTKSVTTTKTEAAPSSITIGKTVTNTTTTVTNTSDLPLGIAIISSSVSGLNSTSLGGTNQTRILKSAAAGLATRFINLLADDCYPAGKCPEIDRLNIFNLDQFYRVERARP